MMHTASCLKGDCCYISLSSACSPLPTSPPLWQHALVDLPMSQDPSATWIGGAAWRCPWSLFPAQHVS